MNRSSVGMLALAITLAGVVVGLILTASRLPPRVASHFNGAGAPDGWMLRNSYLWTMAGIVVGMSVLLVGVFYCIRYLPPSLINLPHRHYWLATDRRAETIEFLFQAGIWLATFQAVFLFAVHLLVVDANVSQPVRLSSYIWILLGGFVLATIVWSYFLIQRFRRVV
jgi:hypothetical protein